MPAGSATSSFFRALCVATALAAAPLAFAQHAADAVPAASMTSTQLAITGTVEHPLTLAVADLKAMPTVDLVRKPERPGDKAQTYTGVRLRDLVEKAKPKAPGHNDLKKMVLVAGATDGYTVVFSWNEVFNTAVGDGVLVVFAKDGAPLDASEGRIALVSLQDLRTGPRHVKWLREVEVKPVAD